MKLRHLLLERKAVTNLESIKSWDIANKGPSSQSYGFSSSHVWMWELDYQESWAPKNWCFRTVVLEMVGLHHWLDGHEFEKAPGVGDGQGSHAAVYGVAKSQTWLSDWIELNRISFLEKCLFRLAIFKLGCISCLCILEIKLLSVTSFANIFSVQRLSFTFIYYFPCFAKAYEYLIRSLLLIFAFISLLHTKESKAYVSVDAEKIFDS